MTLLDSYHENPFFILTASARDTRVTLIEKQEELALFGGEEKAEQAMAKLLNPQTRVEAEIQWFPLMETQESQDLIRFFERHRDDTEMPTQRPLSMLGQFNILRLGLSRIQIQTVSELKAILQSSAIAADALIPRQVMEEINQDRKQSGFPEITNQSEIELQVRELMRETIKAYLDNLSRGITGDELSETVKELKKEYVNASSPYHNSYFLEMAADHLGVYLRNTLKYHRPFFGRSKPLKGETP